MANVSIHYIIYNKERHQDGKYPIKLRFTYKRIPTIVATNLFAVEGELVAVKKGEENKSRTIKEPDTWASVTASHYWYFKPVSGDPSKEKNWIIKATHTIPGTTVTDAYTAGTLTTTLDVF